jgi:hypothetical protein
MDERVILKWILKNRTGGYGVDVPCSGQGPVACACENCNEPLDSIKCWKCLE